MNKRFFKFKNDLSIKSILEYLNISENFFYKYNSKNNNIDDFKINQFSSLSNSSDNSLIFLNKSINSNLKDIKGVCITELLSKENKFKNYIIIPSKNPKLDFCNLINEFCIKKEKKSEFVKINHSLISNTSIKGLNFTIGNFSKIDANVEIGDNVVIGNNVSISQNCLIGHNVHIMDGVCIDCSIIGNNVTISQNTVIGKNGFGFHSGSPNSQIFFHIGGVEIGNDVFIGSNCNVDRGHIDNTTIGDFVRVDNQVHIAHNCQIGKNSILAGKSALSGSVNLGENVILAGDVGIVDNITIGRNSLISAGTKVFKNFPENSKIGGYPARSLYDWQKIQVKLNKMLSKIK
ncbi:MAG: UDP-3-O-(3-hydroxymyristoyl)glucosamine N-acyltransferase [Alphaproteobacteria bacterium]|nr:MAG: UDP-3-O-(3-hydroxymyristoyl)glucosamine N-acyltransferase [Alphaproteobacteria bacterium]